VTLEEAGAMSEEETVSGRPSVVLVDDSADVRALVRRILMSTGFDVVGEGGDGDEAIVLAHRLQPELMLLDVSMPTADGIEALPAILALSPRTRVVMFTGFEEPELAARARSLGVADFVEKSYPIDQLPARLLDVLGDRTSAPGQMATSILPEPADRELLDLHVQEFRELFDRAEIGMATLTVSGTIVRANRAMSGLVFAAPDELVGIDYGRLTVGHGDELDARLDDLITLGADLATFEHPLPAPDGETPSRTVRVTLAPIRDRRRQVLYVFAQVQDVTVQRTVERELRRTEENFRRLVTAVTEYAIFMLDVDGTVISWNEGAQRIKGYAADEIIGRSFKVFYPNGDREARHPEANLEAALRHGSHAEEGWRIRSDGTPFWASVVITAVHDEEGRHIGFAKVTRDQTQQREHEQERQRFVNERIQVLAVTAHELRTPTAVIDGSASALAGEWDTLSPADRDSLLVGIRNSAERLRRLATDLATAARGDGELLALNIVGVSLGSALHAAAARARAAHDGAFVVVDAPPGSIVRADPERLAQALDNLLDNALRHGRGLVHLSAEVGKVATIRVRDEGAGVPDEVRARLFERFATAGPDRGTGLGLYLVREIARRHGGDATYRQGDDPGGAAFEITLPLTPVVTAQH
jgi:PAS domain S-box-containing protein